MIYLFEFISMAFPKSGILISTGAPITISTILFVFAFSKSRNSHSINNRLSRRILGKKYIVLGLCFLFITLINININIASLHSILTSIVLIFSPLAFYIGLKADYEKAMKIMTVSLFIVGTYALVQWIFGIKTTLIPGLTLAYGESITSKPVGFGRSSFEAKKMPTTYQNGNGAAVFYIMSITSILTWSTEDKLYKKFRVISIGMGIIGLALSGARAIVFPVVGVAFFIIYFYVRKLKITQKTTFIILLFFTLIALAIYLFVINTNVLYYFYERYILDLINNPTAAGRTTEYAELFTYISSLNFIEFFKFLLVGSSWNVAIKVEGFLNVMSHYGLITMMLFIGVLAMPIKKIYKFNKPVAISFLCVFISFMVDLQFQYPPSLINYFFIAGLILNNNTYKAILLKKLRLKKDI